MTSGKRRARIDAGLHIVGKPRKGRAMLWYVYAYRGGPQIYTCEGERPHIGRELLDIAAGVRKERFQRIADDLDSLITAYKASPEFIGLGDRTKRDYEIELGQLSEKWGKVSLAVWDDQRMRQDVKKWRGEKSATPRTADKGVVMLATLLAWGVDDARLAINVAAGIPMLYKSDRADVVWLESDFATIKPHCSTQLWSAIRFASLTGFRLGDLVDVEWSHVGDSAIIYITAKRKRRVVVPVLSELRKALDEIEPDKAKRIGTILKNSRGAAWTESGLGGVFQKAKAKAKADGFNIDLRIHDMRGTYATWLARQGLTDQEIARIIGWKEIRVAEIRRRYIDEAQVVTSLVARLERKNNA